MKRTLFLAVIVSGVAMIATSASAQLFRPLTPTAKPVPPITTQNPHAVTVHNAHMARAPKIAPRVYTISQRAAAVAAIGHMPLPPDLSAPFTVSPAHPMLPGIASLSIESNTEVLNGGSYSGDASDEAMFAFCGGACFPMESNPHIQSIAIKFRALEGRHYVLDCRISGWRNTVNYIYYGVQTSGGSSGTASIGPDNHALMMTGVTSASGDMTFAMSLDYSDDPNNSGWGFWGCDVSSF